MDIYEPQGDNLSIRPAIIFAHSGGFINGNRNHEDMVAFCDSLARKGYVTATIDYRKSFYILENVTLHGVRAVYRGIQDGRSAVRFLRANASTYGIDPDKVYMAGSSAGGFIALHAAYMNEPNEQSSETHFSTYTDLLFPFFHEAPEMGPIDIGLHLSENGQPDGIINLWGAIQTKDLITNADYTPALLVHGTADTTVSFERDHPFSFPAFPEVDGSSLIHDTMMTLGITHETYFVTGEPHEFHGTDNGDWPGEPNQFWDIILDRTSSFLWDRHKPLVNFSLQNAAPLTVDFQDESEDALAWWWDFGDSTTSNEQHPTHQYTVEGDYTVTLYIENDKESWNEITQMVTAEDTLNITENNTPNIALYPNPVHEKLHIKGIGNGNISLINMLGQTLLKANINNSIDVSHLPKGLYTVYLTDKNSTQTKKILKL
ncbi:MAG: T9SS type A sorting domain-containing protein [Flavobacteriaceae bacterium]|nr:T9SS type A sorting domain-containing protein [Flavobacteriaceae bacterium]